MLSASLSIIFQHWGLILYLLIIQSIFSVIIVWLLSDISIDKDTVSVLSFLGGILGFTLFCLGIVVLKIKPSQPTGMFVFYISILGLILTRRISFKLVSAESIGLVIFFIFILFTRIIFIQDLVVPPYFDSIQHLLIVKDFLNPASPPNAFYRLSTNLNYYYHFGFHALAAWLSGSTATPPEQAILILGQYFQALAILAIYPLARVITKSTISAWTIMAIAGLFLPIPAYASNWGKYPAIASLTGIAFVLTLISMFHKKSTAISPKFWWALGITTFSTLLLHSRSLFTIILAVLILTIYFHPNFFLKKFEINSTNIEPIITTVVTLSTVLFFLLNLLDLQVSFLFLFTFFCLVLLSFYASFMPTTMVISFMIIMNLSIIIPLPSSLLPTRFGAIFDRPFIIIFFYLPASFLIWNGLDAGIRLFAKHKLNLWRQWLFVGVLTLGIINTIFIRDYRPSECCIFINEDDLFAFEWMKQNIPKDVIVGIAATGKPGNFSASDGGAWIEPSINIPTRKIDTKSNFITTAQSLCKDKVAYFYVDRLENSFDEYNLVEAGGVYVFGLGTVHIYRLECISSQ